MANGRPTGDGSGRSSRGRGDRVANQEGLSALARDMRGGADTGRVANESGLRALGTRIDRSRSRRGRSGRLRWSLGKKVGVVLAAVLVLAVAVAGGSYAYLQYRFDQINKIHVADEVAVQSGQPFTVLVIGSDSRVGDTGAAGSGVRLRLAGHGPAQRRRAAVARVSLDEADPDRVHPA